MQLKTDDRRLKPSLRRQLLRQRPSETVPDVEASILLLVDVVFLHKAGHRRKSSMTRWRNCTSLHSRCRVPSRFRRSLFIEELDEDQGLQKRFPALAKRDRRESGENCTFQHSVRTFSDLWYVPHFELDVQQFFVIEGSCRSRLALELDGQQFFAIDGS